MVITAGDLSIKEAIEGLIKEEMRESLMSRVGVDSNCVTFLLQAMTGDYNPALDNDSRLRPERIALFRIFLYKNNLYTTPQVRKEITRIQNTTNQKNHLLHDMVIFGKVGTLENLGIEEVLQLKNEFMKIHNSENDCQILAEAVRGQLDCFLTYDKNFLKRLVGKTQITLSKPSEHWSRLPINPGTEPKIIPHCTNPLCFQEWWRV